MNARNIAQECATVQQLRPQYQEVYCPMCETHHINNTMCQAYIDDNVFANYMEVM
jgi:DNA topoisomerase IB